MFIDVNREHMHAITLQQIAAVRQRWAEMSRYEFENAVYGNNAVDEFIQWSAERAEYARRAMKLMGITEDDQYFA